MNIAWAGDTLVGRSLGEFVLHERIGQGGFGAVYRAVQPALDRQAVVKVLHSHLHDSGAATERFLREAKLASKLDHPYAAHVYAFGAEPDRTLWIAMELVRGTPLDELLRLQGPLPLERFIPLLERICEVVHTAHEAGIVHRDLKPANVMVVTRAGRLLPKLLDFGIAKGPAPVAIPGGSPPHEPAALPDDVDSLAGTMEATPPPAADASSSSQLTQRGGVIGSPPYMAPEQWLDAGEVGPRTDLYALAILAYECLLGTPPFMGKSVLAIAKAHATQLAPPLGAGFPPELDRVFARALAKRVEDRYGDALELAAAFRAASGIASEPARPPALDAALQRATIDDAPQPIAEAVAAYEASRNPHQARDALALVGRALARYLGLLAIACRSRLASHRDPVDLLRALGRRQLSDAEWVALAVQLTRSWRDHRDAYPIPELVAALHDGDTAAEIDALARLHEQAAGGDALASLLETSVARLERVLTALAFCRDYSLVVAGEAGTGERWMGTRRAQRPIVAVRGKSVEPGAVILLDRDGVPVLALAPLLQIAAPTPGAPPELFLFDGRGRRGAKLVALPAGFEHHDDSLWTWFRDQLAESLDDQEAPLGEERAPYRGLAAFSADDGALFYGREKQVDAFANRLKLAPLLAVVGHSGAGKSSFVQAGVVPALAPGWRAITLRPGPSPLTALTARLEHAGVQPPIEWKTGDSSAVAPVIGQLRDVLAQHAGALGHVLRAEAAARGPLLLVIDQLEEMFTLCDDEHERRLFAEALAVAARGPEDPVRVIFTLRDDFLVRTEQVPALRNRIAQGLQLLTVPVADDLLRILVEPARRAGYELEDGLAEAMVREVADHPGALALLSFTAAKLWELRDRHFKQLTRSAYDTLGGVGGALAHHAEQTLDAMPPDERVLVREAFRHLVTSQQTRAVLGRGELRQILGGDARADGVIEKLVASRLLVAGENEDGDETIEIVHEALLTAWPKLGQWQREDSEGARFREQLRAAARQWHDRDRPRGLLWRGDALADFTRWRARNGGPLTDLEAAFTDASDREAAKSRRNVRLVVAAAFVALAAIVVVLVVSNANVASEQRQTEAANHELHGHLQRQWEVRGQRLSLEGKYLEALAALAHAGELGASGFGHDFLVAQAVRATDGARHVLPHGASVRYPQFSHDDTRLITGALDGKVRVWDTATGSLVLELATGGAVTRTAFAPDDRTVLAASFDGTVRWWDARSGAELAQLAHGKPEWCAVFSPDGKSALVGGDDDMLVLWDLAARRALATVHGDGAGFHACAFSPDGKRFAAGDRHGTTWLWNAATGALAQRHPDQHQQVNALAFSPDSERLVAASDDHDVIVWDLGRGAVAHRLPHRDGVHVAAFSPDGQQVLTASLEGAAFVYDARTGALVHRLSGHAAGVTGAAWSPDGAYIATCSEDQTARLWDARTGKVAAIWQRHEAFVWALAFDHKGRQVVTAGTDNTAILWDARPQLETLRLDAPPDTYWATFSRDGALAALGTKQGVVTVFDSRSGRRVVELPADASGGTIVHLAFDASSQHLASTADDGVTRIWDLAAPASAPRRIGGLGDDAASADWSPDGDLLVVGNSRGHVRAWSITGEARFDVRSHGDVAVRWVSFDREGKRIYTVTYDGYVEIWSRDGALLAGFDADVHFETIAFDPTAHRVLSLTAGAGVEIYDLETWRELTLIGHDAKATRGAWHPSGELVATGGLDGTARLWDAETGSELATLREGGHEISVAFAPDGRLLVAGDDGSTVIVTLPEYRGSPAAFRRLLDCRVPFQVRGDGLEPRARSSAECDGI